MKHAAIIIFIALLAFTHANTAHAQTSPPILIESFTGSHPYCSPIAPTAEQDALNAKRSNHIYNLPKQYPNDIVLNFHMLDIPHIHGPDGSHITPPDIDADLHHFISTRGGNYVFKKGFLEKYSGSSIVINANHKTNGTNLDIIDAAVNLSRQEANYPTIKIITIANALAFKLPDITDIINDRTADLAIIGYNTDNKNKVTSLKRLEPWNGTARGETVSTSDMNDANGFAVIAQDQTNGKILAIGKIER